KENHGEHRREQNGRPPLLDYLPGIAVDHDGEPMRHIESDYDHDQDRWRTVVSVGDRFGSGDVFQPTADRIVAENLRPVLDMGCGDGRLPKHLPDGWP
ncbi:MAG: hypothetical protein JOZ68_05945, partial [Acidimicrobiia bacterium]|nr:hypothetical protein [Acidimicrobiia bacterium]